MLYPGNDNDTHKDKDTDTNSKWLKHPMCAIFFRIKNYGPFEIFHQIISNTIFHQKKTAGTDNKYMGNILFNVFKKV